MNLEQAQYNTRQSDGNIDGIFYRDCGPMRPEAVLFLHSLGLDSRMWQDQIDALTKLGRRVLALDSRGHGRSVWREVTASGKIWTEDILSVLDRLDVESVDAVGLSMGGTEALHFAGIAPERVRTLILCDTFLRVPHDKLTEKIKGMRERIANIGMAEFAKQYSRSRLSEKSPFKNVNAKYVVDAIANLTPAAYLKSAQACFESDLVAVAGGVDVETLVLWGTEDLAAPEENAIDIWRQIRRARLVKIPDAGHLSSLDQPSVFNKLVARFLDEVAPVPN